MTAAISRLRIAGTELPIETHCLACQVNVSRNAQGRRTLSLSASGFFYPALGAVAWTSAVGIEWLDVASDSAAWLSLAILSPGVEVGVDLDAVTADWTLGGVEADPAASPIIIGSTHYWGEVWVSPPKSLARRQVKLTGEGISAPTMTGATVSVVTPLFSGTLIALGVESQSHEDTGLVSWSLEGYETTTGSALVSINGAAYWATLKVSLTQSGTRRAISISGESAAAPAVTAGVVSVTAPLYTGSMVVTAQEVTTAPETGLVTWTLTGWNASAGIVVGIGGANFFGTVAVSPLDEPIQRKSDGSGTLMRVWDKSAVKLNGTGTSAPSVTAGVVTITSTLYTGSILTSGVSVSLDCETGLVTWSITGEEP